MKEEGEGEERERERKREREKRGREREREREKEQGNGFTETGRMCQVVLISAKLPPMAPSTHCQSLSLEEKKLANVSLLASMFSTAALPASEVFVVTAHAHSTRHLAHYADNKLSHGTTCLKFILSSAMSLRHSARNWMACLIAHDQFKSERPT